jgi:hypothetical protein
MQLDLTTPALLFSAISLLLLAYTNRFLTIATVIRGLGEKIESLEKAVILGQLKNLQFRVKLIKLMQLLGVFSFFLCVLCMFLLFGDQRQMAQVVFATALLAFMSSLIVSLWEIFLSSNALDLHLEGIRKKIEKE